MRIILLLANFLLIFVFGFATSRAYFNGGFSVLYYLSIAFAMATLWGNIIALWPGRES